MTESDRRLDQLDQTVPEGPGIAGGEVEDADLDHQTGDQTDDHETDDHETDDHKTDEEEIPTGPRRILIALYAIFALAATARAIVQISTTFDQAPLAYLLSLLSGVVYIGATTGLLTEKRWSRPLAWASCGTEMVGVLVIGAISIFDKAAFPADTVWSRFGSGYGYFPILLPVLGLLWLRYSSQAARSDPDDLAGQNDIQH